MRGCEVGCYLGYGVLWTVCAGGLGLRRVFAGQADGMVALKDLIAWFSIAADLCGYFSIGSVVNGLWVMPSRGGALTIPSEIRRKYGLRNGSCVEFIEPDGGVLIVPVVPLEDVYGADRDRKEVVYRMIRELQDERRKEATDE